MLTRWRRALVLLVSLLVLVLAGRPAHAAEAVRLWHSYRGAEREALEKLVEETFPGTVTLLAVPYDAFSAKLSAAIPLGEGPHLFIDAHERLGSYREQRLVAPVGDLFDPADFLPAAVDAVTLEGKAYALPLSLKSVALYYRTDLVSGPPETIEGLADRLRAPLPQGSYLLAYESRGVYMHAPILHAFGGRLLGPDGQFGFVGPEAEASLIFAKDLADRGVTPKAADGALVTRLFVAGKAAYAISGPWLASDLGPEVPFAVTPLPKLAATGEPLRPLLTVEAVMLSPEGAKFERARSVARMLASVGPAIEREHIASAVSARRDLPPPADPVVAAFAAQAREAVPMSSSVAMRAVWEPAEKALRKVLAGTATPSEALAEAKRRFDDVQRAPAPPASPTPLLVVAGLLLLLGAALLVRRVRRDDFRETLRDSVPAYRYVAHAVVALGLLVFAPLLAGAFISLYAGPPGSEYYVGTANFVEILTARGGPLLATGSFYFVLLVTLAWTALNLLFHLGIGLTLGVLLSRPGLRFRGIYRVLLILPWAVPSYVTALAWKGMFHEQFGAVNALLAVVARTFGLELAPIAWFERFSTAFAANVATNVWLGFPFMMVVTMAALTSVPSDCLEAAEVDGATRLQRFFLVTLPIVRPSMVPATVLGAIWTFNMFNVVFLVSGGEPDGTTDILVSEAYRWAFTRQAQYGYAAAYAVLIFLLLTGVTRFPEWWRARRATTIQSPEEPALETVEAT